MTCKEYAARALAMRPRSRAELHELLLRHSYPREEADSTVAEFAERGYLDDAEYARLLIRSAERRGKGVFYMRENLLSHKLPHDIVREALEDYEPNEEELNKLWNKFLNKYGDAEKTRTALIRRGFTRTQIRHAEENCNNG